MIAEIWGMDLTLTRAAIGVAMTGMGTAMEMVANKGDDVLHASRGS